jgi:drug/metabolite transporter (DMT)-like permease
MTAMPAPGLPTVAALIVSMVSVSSSAPLIAYAAAPALAIAFWRNALAVGVLVPVAATRRRAELGGLVRASGRRTLALSALAGLALAAHFGAWVPSAKLTTAAAATAMVSTQPVWTAVLAAVRRVPVRRATWLGIAVAVVGAALATGADIAVSGRAVTGDLLAVAGGMAGAFAGWILGAGALLIPGVGPFIAAGAIASALTGAALGAGLGAIGGALTGMGVPEEEAHWYAKQVQGGSTLVTVDAAGRFREAQEILRRHGGEDVRTRDRERVGYGVAGGSSSMEPEEEAAPRP